MICPSNTCGPDDLEHVYVCFGRVVAGKFDEVQISVCACACTSMSAIYERALRKLHAVWPEARGALARCE